MDLTPFLFIKIFSPAGLKGGREGGGSVYRGFGRNL
jgi:hypothetical protein